MASEIHVLFRGVLPHLNALSRTMEGLGFPFTVRYSNGSLEGQRGFMPMRLRREQTGVEFDVFDGRAAVEELAGKDVDPAFDRSGNFRWSGDDDEMLAVGQVGEGGKQCLIELMSPGEIERRPRGRGHVHSEQLLAARAA